MGTGNKANRARVLGNGCGQRCRFKCHDKFNENQRQKIFHDYWNIGDVNRQRDYLSNWVTATPKKVTTCNTSPNKRKNSRTWQFKVDGIFIRVCKTFFLETLDISHQVVDTALKKGAHKQNNVSGIVSPDKRGKHDTRANKLPADKLMQVKGHINSFPRVESHYCRKDTSKEYLEPGLSIPKMYNLYTDHCEEKNFSQCQYTHTGISLTHISILGFIPRPRIGVTYVPGMKMHLKLKRALCKGDYDNHIRNKQLAREMKEEDKAKAKNVPHCSAACFDLQQILVTPHSNESVLYYSRKLCTFNLTVYDLGSKEGYSYIWHEAISGRGADEIASCVYMYLKSQANLGKKRLPSSRTIVEAK